MSTQNKTMPKVGFGLWKISKETCADAVYNAIKAGYRHLDSASDYGNEVEVGNGIKRAIDDGLCRRDELWITSKLWNTFHHKEHVEPAIRRSLQDLQLEYLDLYLIHFPIAQPYVDFDDRYPPEWIFDPRAAEPRMETAPVPLHETWQAMEALVEAGLTTQIGVCNYNTGLLHDLMSYATIKPAVLQVESHPYLTQQRLMKLASNYGIQVTAFSPLGALSYLELDMAGAKESVLEQDVVKAAAKRIGKTPAQIVLRWGVQRGNAIIPKTSRPERLAENLAIFDFELSETEMTAIDALNCNRRFNDPGQFCEAAFNTFYPIYD
ncbi:MAG: aldo/keto reductase [Paraglaciecola sp.]|uniref:aldo/keto reductase n=1 Tax=Paraglaciecola sp. TaxID=1920173 RepID=UPI00273E6C57|nr:aldo/keto reductase [Paraglaciecola sp.]MDP5032270.1 aldo/keto reductase [Paraglaciecola sp.]MDP5134210.1 aldo/keto reductase [Paraglaciecola sp.]